MALFATDSILRFTVFRKIPVKTAVSLSALRSVLLPGLYTQKLKAAEGPFRDLGYLQKSPLGV